MRKRFMAESRFILQEPPVLRTSPFQGEPLAVRSMAPL